MCNSLQDVNASSYTPSLTLPRVEGRLGLLFSWSLFSGRVVELNKHIYVAKICGLLNIFKSTVCLVLQSLTSTSGLNMLPNGANPNCLRGTRPQISASLHRSTATDFQLWTDDQLLNSHVSTLISMTWLTFLDSRCQSPTSCSVSHCTQIINISGFWVHVNLPASS